MLLLATTARANLQLDPGNSLSFFTNVAMAMFQQMDMHDFNGNLVTVTNIPIYEDPALYGGTNINYYTPAVHRVLQLAANLFDATTNRFVGDGPTNYPTVFRPIFRSQNGIACIVGYTEVRNTLAASLPMLDPGNFAKAEQPVNVTVNLYGVPWVIGAKKGFPNFNEFSMENALTVARILEFTNSSTILPPDRTKWATNQIWDLAITNGFGFEVWNSYTNLYGRNLQLTVSNEWSIFITNEIGIPLLLVTNQAIGTNIYYPSWPGWSGQLMNDISFKIPLAYQAAYTNGIYLQTPPSIRPLTPPGWNATYVPHLTMLLQVKVRCVLIDTTANRVVDFVNLVSTQPAVDVASQLDNQQSTFQRDNNLFAQWDTNYISGIPWGIWNQIYASRGDMAMSDWTIAQDPNIILEQQVFRSRLMNNGIFNGSRTNYFRAPYRPKRTIRQRISWEANDPLVHFTVPDLTSTNGVMKDYNSVDTGIGHFALTNLGSLNYAYQPWGGYHLPGGSPLNSNPEYDWNVQVKDPAVQQSDNWSFPTGESLGFEWLGRVHRGTPWQTVFLKSANITQDAWRRWANDNVLVTNDNGHLNYDGVWTHPTNDWRIASLWAQWMNTDDLFTRLSINNRDPNAWAARLDGLTAFTNATSGALSPITITSNSPQAGFIAQAIQTARANTDANNLIFPCHTFQQVGDVLAAPELSAASPFLNTNVLVNNLAAGGITDEVIEAIPTQLLPLLRLDSIGQIAPQNGQLTLSFSGYDGHAYAIETSSDLTHWVTLSTQCPSNGVFSITNPATSSQQFYRSVLLH